MNRSALEIAKGVAEETGALLAGDICNTNIFVADGATLCTPSTSTGCLAGVTRALVLAWCDVVERDAPIGVLADADEVFLASTTRDVQAVHRCDQRDLEAPGPVTAQVMKVWSERAAADIDP